MVASLCLPRIWEQTSIGATAKRWPGPRTSALTLSMAAVGTTKTVSLWPQSCHGRGCEGPCGWHRSPHRKPPCLSPSGIACRSTHPDRHTHASPNSLLSKREQSLQIVSPAFPLVCGLEGSRPLLNGGLPREASLGAPLPHLRVVVPDHLRQRLRYQQRERGCLVERQGLAPCWAWPEETGDRTPPTPSEHQ